MNANADDALVPVGKELRPHIPGISTSRIRTLARNGEIKMTIVGGELHAKRGAIRDWLKARLAEVE